MMPEGDGQIIAGVGYIGASRAFDQWGKNVPSRSFRKSSVSGYVEYGLTPGLTLVVAPTAARMQSGWLTQSYNGSDESAFGARALLYDGGTRVLSVQALVAPSFGPRAIQSAFGGPQAAATDIRLQFGQNFRLFGCPAFVDAEPGVHLRGGPWPNEARLDVTLGVRPTTHDMILLQSFTITTMHGATTNTAFQSSKLQLSLVHDLSRRVSIQLGALAAIAGQNAAREMGPVFALWIRF